jgi:hypothetical protein
MWNSILHFFGIASQTDVAAVKTAMASQASQISDLYAFGFIMLCSIGVIAAMVLIPMLWRRLTAGFERIKNYRHEKAELRSVAKEQKAA